MSEETATTDPLVLAADEIERLRAALQAIVDFRPEREELGGDFYAEVDACQECEVWRQRKHPIQSMCEAHVRRSYAVQDSNARSAAVSALHHAGHRPEGTR